MKKTFLSLFLLLSSTFALAQDLTVGDTLTLYFSELFPVVYTSHNEVVLKYTDIGNKPVLRSVLQRGIYYGMVSNTSAAIKPDNLMTDKMFSALLKKHFGIEIAADSSILTLSEYQNFMKSVRLSFAYTLLKKINATSSGKTSVTEVPAVSRL